LVPKQKESIQCCEIYGKGSGDKKLRAVACYEATGNVYYYVLLIRGVWVSNGPEWEGAPRLVDKGYFMYMNKKKSV